MRKKIVFKGFLLIMVALLATSGLYAGDVDRKGTGAAPQLLIPVGGRNFAMGGADIAGTEALDAIYWNPAGLGLLKGGSAMFSTMGYMGDADITVNYISGAYNAGFGVIGVTFKTLDVGDIPLTTNLDPLNESGATFTLDNSIIGLTYANKFSDAIAFGITMNYVSEGVPGASATAVAFDFGLQYRNLGGVENLDFGIVAKNIGTDMTYEGNGLLHEGTIDGSYIPQYFYSIPTETFVLPANYQLGLTYNMRFDADNVFKVAGTFISENLDSDKIAVGAEYVFMDIVAARLGYQMFPENDDDLDQNIYGFHGGLGVQYGFGDVKLRVDYVYQAMEYFGGNNLFAFSIDF
jgi:hypothetical protein